MVYGWGYIQHSLTSYRFGIQPICKHLLQKSPAYMLINGLSARIISRLSVCGKALHRLDRTVLAPFMILKPEQLFVNGHFEISIGMRLLLALMVKHWRLDI